MFFCPPNRLTSSPKDVAGNLRSDARSKTNREQPPSIGLPPIKVPTQQTEGESRKGGSRVDKLPTTETNSRYRRRRESGTARDAYVMKNGEVGCLFII